MGKKNTAQSIKRNTGGINQNLVIMTAYSEGMRSGWHPQEWEKNHEKDEKESPKIEYKQEQRNLYQKDNKPNP